MKKFLSLFSCILTGIVVLICVAITNGTFSVGSGETDNFTVNSYDISMVVNNENICSVTETISVTFPSYEVKHGIYRYIPYEIDAKFVENNEVITKKYGAYISDIYVNKIYEIYDENNCMVIKIGSEYVNVSGQTLTYVISYDYSMGYDRDETKDFLYFNMIGTGWNTTLNNVTFDVTMPDDFDSNKVNIYYGLYGSSSTITPTINGKQISGSISSLNSNEAITIKVDLPNDYFTVDKINYNLDWLLVLLSILMLVFVLILTNKHSGEHIVQTVEVLPPTNLTPSDCGFYLNGKIRNKDITSLIVYWANAGYLHIKVEEAKTILTKLKEMTNAKQYEINLFNKLFESSAEIVVEDNIDVFANESIKTVSKIKRACNAPRVDKESFKSFSLALILTFIPFIVLSISYCTKMNLPFNAIGFIVGLFIAFVLTSGSMIFTFSDLSKGTKEFFGKFFTLINLGIFATFVIILFNDRTLDAFGVSIFIALLGIFGIYMSSKLLFFKKNVNENLGKILGFKNFLINAEQKRMEVLLKDNPNYFYDVLSYAYVMDIEDEFIKKFDKLLISSPEWCESSSLANNLVMFHILNHNLNAVNRSITSAIIASQKSNVSSGGFGGGGGFSGGGFGGGGGGSW